MIFSAASASVPSIVRLAAGRPARDVDIVRKTLGQHDRTGDLRAPDGASPTERAHLCDHARAAGRHRKTP